jgi:hypothetical protein
VSTAMNRLLGWHWLLIGAGASLILFLILFFAVIRPKQVEAAQVTSDAAGIETSGGTPEMVSAKNAELTKAKGPASGLRGPWRAGRRLPSRQ